MLITRRIASHFTPNGSGHVVSHCYSVVLLWMKPIFLLRVFTWRRVRSCSSFTGSRDPVWTGTSRFFLNVPSQWLVFLVSIQIHLWKNRIYVATLTTFCTQFRFGYVIGDEVLWTYFLSGSTNICRNTVNMCTRYRTVTSPGNYWHFRQTPDLTIQGNFFDGLNRSTHVFSPKPIAYYLYYRNS